MIRAMMTLLAVIGVLCACAWASQESGSGVPDLSERLAALSPDDPMAYFELAEEIAFEMPMGVSMELARRLFVLSSALDARSASPIGLTPSVCIALAELSIDSEERRWLRAMAESLQRSDGQPMWSVRADVSATDDTPEEFAKSMGMFRGGDGGGLRSMLRRVSAETLLRDAGMDQESALGVAQELERLAPLMRPKGVGRDGRVIRIVRDGQQIVEIDPETGGNPGPDLPADSFIDHLRGEVLLLGGEPSSWSAQLLLDRGRPFRDLDPDELSAHFGVDLTKTIWREGSDAADWTGGQWVRP